MKKRLLLIAGGLIVSINAFTQINYVFNATVTTLAGSGTKGTANGSGANASFSKLGGIVAEPLGDNIYVVDSNCIRKITKNGVVTTFAGSYQSGSTNATGTNARFNNPQDLAIDMTGNIYVADEGNYLIRKITPAGVVTTFAGNGVSGTTDGQGTNASFDSFNSITRDQNSQYLYVTNSYKIRKIKISDGTVTTIQNITNNSGNMGGAPYCGWSSKIVADNNGDIYYSDQDQPFIHKISNNIDNVYAGNLMDWNYVDGNLSDARFQYPQSIVRKNTGLFVSEGGTFGASIRYISSDNKVSTLAGSATQGKADGNEQTATFTSPSFIGLDSLDNLFVVDATNYIVRKINIGAIITAIEKNNPSLSFTLFPNPATDKLYVSGSSKIISCQVIDVMGREIININGNNQSNNISVETASFAKGTYYIKILSQEGTSIKSFVKD